MRQRGRSVCVRRRGCIGDAGDGMQQQCRRHQYRDAIGDAGALAVIGAVAAAFVTWSGCVRRHAALIHAVIKHAVIRHAAVRVRHVRVFVTGRFGSRRGSSRRSGSDGVVRTGRVHRRHRATDAVRHQGEAEQSVQQEWAKAHCRSVLPVYSARSRSVHLHANRGHVHAISSAAARFPPLAKTGCNTSLFPAQRGEGGAKRRMRGCSRRTDLNGSCSWPS